MTKSALAAYLARWMPLQGPGESSGVIWFPVCNIRSPNNLRRSAFSFDGRGTVCDDL